MKAVVFHEHGSVSNLRLEEFPDPVAGAGDVIIRVRATSLNGFDPMILGGTTGLRTPLPMIPCGDFAGEMNLSSIQRGAFQSCYVGYWIDEARAGQGYTPEALAVAVPVQKGTTDATSAVIVTVTVGGPASTWRVLTVINCLEPSRI